MQGSAALQALRQHTVAQCTGCVEGNALGHPAINAFGGIMHRWVSAACGPALCADMLPEAV
jgi:hypothetical protein